MLFYNLSIYKKSLFLKIRVNTDGSNQIQQKSPWIYGQSYVFMSNPANSSSNPSTFLYNFFAKFVFFVHFIGEKPYKCDYCDMSFSRPQNRKEHQARHLTNPNLMGCSICQMGFADKANYDKHVKKVRR